MPLLFISALSLHIITVVNAYHHKILLKHFGSHERTFKHFFKADLIGLLVKLQIKVLADF